MNNLKVKLIKSLIGRPKIQRACVRGLGLNRIGSTRIVKATPQHLGLINKIKFLLDVQEINTTL